MTDFGYKSTADSLEVYGLAGFDLNRACNCGQAFRWKPLDGGRFACVVGGNAVNVGFRGDVFTITSTGEMPDPAFFFNYFDLNRDYAALESELLRNDVLRVCVPYAGGIRVFNQEPFETLISFIISANNNIKRISRTIDSLCAAAGEPCANGEGNAFPTPKAIAAMSVDSLVAIGTGYRAPYIKATAAAIADGFPLDGLRQAEYKIAKKELCMLAGVGPKVADCVLLFSLGHTGAFPMDVWMKRAVSTMFFGGATPSKSELEQLIQSLGPCAGIIQQYIFHFARETGMCAAHD